MTASAAGTADAPPSVVRALSRVMADVRAVGKHDRNPAQGFSFRGVDAVVNAVSPVLRRHGVVVVPDEVEQTFTTIEVGHNRTRMGHVIVKVTYVFHGPAGDAITAVVLGEAMDAGDKAVAKAMSVAFRTLLIQALVLPTDEPDPDTSSYERSTPPGPGPGTFADPLAEAKTRLWNVAQAAGMDLDALRAGFEQYAAVPLDDAAAGQLAAYADRLAAQADERPTQESAP